MHSHNASETKLIVYHQFTTKKFLSESIKEKEADLVSWSSNPIYYLMHDAHDFKCFRFLNNQKMLEKHKMFQNSEMYFSTGYILINLFSWLLGKSCS